MYGNLDYKNTIIKRCCFLHIQCHLDKMTNICHELQYKIWDPLLSRTIICHEIKGHEKIKFKIQVTKAKKKRISPPTMLKYLLFLSLFLPSHFSTCSLFLPLFLPTHFYLFAFSLPLKTHNINNPLKLHSSLNLLKLHSHLFQKKIEKASLSRYDMDSLDSHKITFLSSQCALFI